MTTEHKRRRNQRSAAVLGGTAVVVAIAVAFVDDRRADRDLVRLIDDVRREGDALRQRIRDRPPAGFSDAEPPVVLSADFCDPLPDSADFAPTLAIAWDLEGCLRWFAWSQGEPATTFLRPDQVNATATRSVDMLVWWTTGPVVPSVLADPLFAAEYAAACLGCLEVMLLNPNSGDLEPVRFCGPGQWFCTADADADGDIDLADWAHWQELAP